MAVRVKRDPEIARGALSIPPRSILKDEQINLEDCVSMATYFLQIGFWLTLVLGGLAWYQIA